MAAWPGREHEGKVRVGMLAPCLVQGGAEQWMLTLARSVGPARVAWVGAAIAPDSYADPAMVAALGESMPVARGRAAMRALAAASDVLVTWAVDGLPEILSGLPSPPRVIAAIHAPPESEWGRTVYAKPEGIDRWVAVSELALDSLPEHSKAAAPASIIWNAVDAGRLGITRDRATVRAAWGVPAAAPVAVFLQRLAAEKDAPASARLASALPAPWHVVVVGDGSIRPEVERLKSEMGLDRLHLVGKDPRAGDVLNASDVFLCCSDYESFCLSMAEAITLGLPVVSTPVGLAKLVPGIAVPVPFAAGPETLAAAVLAAHAEGPRPAARALVPRLAPDRFGREWADLIVSLAPPRRPVADQVRLAILRNACPHATKVPGCGCDDRICSAREGARMSRAACYRCLEAR